MKSLILELLPHIHDAPSGQLLHPAVPDTSLYVPSSHAVHGPPLGPVKPVLQVQSVEKLLAAGEVDPAMYHTHATLIKGSVPMLMLIETFKIFLR